MNAEIRNAFEAIGADVLVETAGNVFEIDVEQNGGREVYRLRYPMADSIRTEALDVKPRQRHLVLDVSGSRLPVSGRYLSAMTRSTGLWLRCHSIDGPRQFVARWRRLSRTSFCESRSAGA